MGELDDLYGTQKIKEANEARLVKDARSGQRSLFFEDYFKDANTEGMKKAAVNKANKADDEETAKAKAKAEAKAKARAAENEDFKDKRQPKSDLIRQAELEKMKEILNKPKGGGGSGGGMGGNKLSNRDLTKNYKTGGKVSSASKRADGCCIRGKTRA
jgi:membrane protein involved in colicin uptake